MRRDVRLGGWAAVAVAAALLACGGSRKQAPVAVHVPPTPAPRPAPAEPATAPEAPTAEPSKPSPFPGREPTVSKPSPERPRAAGDDVEDLYEARVYRDAHGAELPYRIFRPARDKGGGKRALILLLHGASARGSDNVRQLAASYGAAFWASPAVQELAPAYVVAPQSDPKYAPTWVRAWREPAKPDPKRPEPLELALELVERLQGELPIDPQRVYVVGYSMGGFGAWIAISRHPETFAAAAPIAGGGDPTHVTQTKAAVWAFHGATDTSVPARRSREMVEALKQAGGQVRYTEYAGAGHQIWERVWAEPGLAEWLFSQRAK